MGIKERSEKAYMKIGYCEDCKKPRLICVENRCLKCLKKLRKRRKRMIKWE